MLAIFICLPAFAPRGGMRRPEPAGGALAARARQPLLQVKQKDGGGAPSLFGRGAMPEGQGAVDELRQLRKQAFLDWASSEDYADKLVNLYGATMLLISLPVAYTTFDRLPEEIPQLLISANMGTLVFMIGFVLRLRLSWGLVGERLREKKSYYEANQVGNFFTKDREERGRDQLLVKEVVSPSLRRIDVSLYAIFAALILTVGVGEVVTAIEGEAGPATLSPVVGEEAIRFNNKLRGDDEFAAREQQRARRRADENGEGVKPLYCDSRYYKILAGGNGQGGVGCGGE